MNKKEKEYFHEIMQAWNENKDEDFDMESIEDMEQSLTNLIGIS
jgi:hypothetical protein